MHIQYIVIEDITVLWVTPGYEQANVMIGSLLISYQLL